MPQEEAKIASWGEWKESSWCAMLRRGRRTTAYPYYPMGTRVMKTEMCSLIQYIHRVAANSRDAKLRRCGRTDCNLKQPRDTRETNVSTFGTGPQRDQTNQIRELTAQSIKLDVYSTLRAKTRNTSCFTGMNNTSEIVDLPKAKSTSHQGRIKML